jgi:ferrous iron transport protein B
MMEMPKYQLPALPTDVRSACGSARSSSCARRHDHPGHDRRSVGAASFPQAGPGEKPERSIDRRPDRQRLEVVVKPIGFNHEIALALIPAMAAREVAVSALATVYSRSTRRTRSASRAGADRAAARPLERCRPRSPSSPGSCSRRNASRPSRSPGARPTAGSGRLHARPTCSRSPIFGGRTYWTAVALGLSCPRNSSEES